MVAGQLPALVNGSMSQQGTVRERCTRCVRSPGGLLEACPARCELMKNLLLGIYESLHSHKTVFFPPNINRVATSHLAVDLTGEYSGVSGRPRIGIPTTY
jgi:hypothetical protein